MRLVQLSDKNLKRHVAAVEDNQLRLISGFDSVYRIALAALEYERRLLDVLQDNLSSEFIDYDAVHAGEARYRVLPAFDHPDEKARCLVSGTGLTHLASAKNRDSMHTGEHTLTDSMRMYQWGVEGGRPAAGKIGVQPEWFYKGNGTILRGHGEPLDVPPYADDGGEEPEIAGLYLIDWSGQPRRVGFCMGNEFSDHKMETKNYLYLAPSKLRSCAIGPELVTDAEFEDVRGSVHIQRKGERMWSKDLATGGVHMCHSLANMEYHHFKYEAHRQPGDVHIHFFGAGAFSFGEGILLEDRDVMEIGFENFGRVLRNPIQIVRSPLISTAVAQL